MEDAAHRIEDIASNTSRLMLVIALLTLVGAGVAFFSPADHPPTGASPITPQRLRMKCRGQPGGAGAVAPDTTSLLATMVMMRDSLAQVEARACAGQRGRGHASAQIAQGN